MTKQAFLDQHVVAKPFPSVIEIMRPFYENDWQSPSSPHLGGQKVLRKMQGCYESLYRQLELDPTDTLVVTSSAAEAINHVTFVTYLNVTRPSGKNHFITSNVDEAPVIMSMERLFPLGCSCKMVKVDDFCTITPESLEETISPRTALLSVSWANALTGVIQPIEELGAICKDRGIIFHVDASQVLGKLPFSLKDLPIDILSFSSSPISPNCIKAQAIIAAPPSFNLSFEYRFSTLDKPSGVIFSKSGKLL
mgnify:CR=1 FL=1